MPDEDPQAESTPSATTPPAMPRWVKALGVALLAVVVIVVVAMLLSGVQHGPGLHG